MAYNNNFPVTYPQYYPQYPQGQQPQPQTQGSMNTSSSMIWVQGEAGAKSYLVAPNTTVQLWDSEAPIIYLKSADASGMPSMKTLDYVIREQAQPQVKMSVAEQVDYVTHEELDDFKKEIIRKFDELKEDTGA